MTAFRRIGRQTETARRVFVSFSLILSTCSVIAASKGETERAVRTFPIIRHQPKAEVCFRELVGLLC